MKNCVSKCTCFEKAYKPTHYVYPCRPSLEEIAVKDSPALFPNIEDAIQATNAAQKQYATMTLDLRRKIVEAIRSVALQFAEDFALCALAETGRGRYEDKLAKQILAVNSTPGVEFLTPKCFSGDKGLSVIDYSPYGVIGAVTPVTNPTATVINNSITVLSGGNGVVFNPHPGAKLCTTRAIAVLNNAICRAGGPCCLLSSVVNPTVESGQTMFKSPKLDLNLITGGPAVVKIALASGKRSICAGPGNPPVVVDETANIEVAAKGIYNGASFDNNMICSDEKEVFCVSEVTDKLLEKFKELGAYVATEKEMEKLTAVAIPGERQEFHHGVIDKDLVGKNANELLSRIGVNGVSDDCRLIVGEVNPGHPLVWTEQLMPIIPIVRVANFDEALGYARRSEYGFRHTSSIYSQNLDNITRMGRQMNTSIFTVNGSHTAGLAYNGEGYTSFSIAGYTGEGMTTPLTFVRQRKMVCVDSLRFV